jgi:antirepressor protein
MSLPQRTVHFHGDDLVAVQQSDGTIFVVFIRLCENLGLNRLAQVRRIQRHAILNPGLVTLTVQTPGGPQALQCLKLSLLPLWLSGVQATRIKPELQAQLVRYQAEAADVLWQAFKPQILIEDRSLAPADDAVIAQLERLVEQSRAITRLAEEQLALARRMQDAARVVKRLQGDLADVQGQVADVHVRLGVLEDQLHPAAYLTDAQAAEVSHQVKALAELLTSQEAGKNHYQGIFAELYRRFGVGSYKIIRQEQYTAVLAFLDDWRRAAQSSP